MLRITRYNFLPNFRQFETKNVELFAKTCNLGNFEAFLTLTSRASGVTLYKCILKSNTSKNPNKKSHIAAKNNFSEKQTFKLFVKKSLSLRPRPTQRKKLFLVKTAKKYKCAIKKLSEKKPSMRGPPYV